jgi:hypothetical protein
MDVEALSLTACTSTLNAEVDEETQDGLLVLRNSVWIVGFVKNNCKVALDRKLDVIMCILYKR